MSYQAVLLQTVWIQGLAGIGQNASCAVGDFKLGLSLVRELWFTDCSYMYNLPVHVEQKDVLNHRLVGFVAAILIFHYYKHHNTTEILA